MRAGIAVLLLCGGALGLALGVAPDLAPGGGWQRWQAWRERDEAPLLREPEPPPLRLTGLPRALDGRGQFGHRKRCVKGTSVAVRVDLGGRGVIKKKTKKNI